MNDALKYTHFWEIYFELAEYVRNVADPEVVRYKQSLLFQTQTEVDQLILADSNCQELSSIQTKLSYLLSALDSKFLSTDVPQEIKHISIRAFDWYSPQETIAVLRDAWIENKQAIFNYEIFHLYFSGGTLRAEPIVWLKTATELVGWFHQMAGSIIPRAEYLKKVWEIFVDKNGNKFNYRSFHSLTSAALNSNQDMLIQRTLKKIING